MSNGQVLVLGAIAGFTIFLGLPLGRVSSLSVRARAFLNATAAGILVFLLVEVTGHGIEPVEEALTRVTSEGGGTWGAFFGKATLFVALFAVGALGLVYHDRWLRRRSHGFGPGAAAVQELEAPLASLGSPRESASRSSSRWGSGCTTSPRGSRSDSRPRAVRSASRCCS